MRTAPLVVLVGLVLAALVPVGAEPAGASCAAPKVQTAGLGLRAGATVTVDGVGFVDGCQDVRSCTGAFGCSRCTDGPEPAPYRDIILTLRQGGRTWTLGEADARTAAGSVTWTVRVPAEVRPGRAVLVPEHGEKTEVRVARAR